jgi:cysteinyl-tRNA synthetase
MAEKHLGPEFELHGGGIDLRFPHHENELAQSRGAGREFARVWAHNGMLELAQEKMSKSLGNIVSLRDALDRWGREPVLLLFLGAHYRSPVEFSEDAMEQARAQWDDFRTAYRTVPPSGGSAPTWEDFARALDDDFNTPRALSILHAWRAHRLDEWLQQGLSVFGLSTESEDKQVRAGDRIRLSDTARVSTIVGSAPLEVRELAEQRDDARQRRDFPEADRLRAEIEEAGWEVQDVPDGYRLIPRA